VSSNLTVVNLHFCSPSHPWDDAVLFPHLDSEGESPKLYLDFRVLATRLGPKNEEYLQKTKYCPIIGRHLVCNLPGEQATFRWTLEQDARDEV
jgi:hypothetical protein